MNTKEKEILFLSTFSFLHLKYSFSVVIFRMVAAKQQSSNVSSTLRLETNLQAPRVEPALSMTQRNYFLDIEFASLFRCHQNLGMLDYGLNSKRAGLATLKTPYRAERSFNCADLAN